MYLLIYGRDVQLVQFPGGLTNLNLAHTVVEITENREKVRFLNRFLKGLY